MAIFKSSLFGAKETELTPEEKRLNTLHKLAEARISANRICDELDSIDYNKIRNQTSIKTAEIEKYIDGAKVNRTGVEIVNDIESYLRALRDRIAKEDTATLVIAETERIDSKLIYFSEILNESLQNGDLYTAEVCEIALVYGVIRGHKPIPNSLSTEERERELTEREKKIEIYKEMVKTSKEIHKLSDTSKSIKNRYMNEVLPKYEEAHKDFLNDKAKNSSIYAEIAGKSGNGLTGQHLVAYEKTQRDNNLYRTAENIVKQLAGIDSNISNYEMTITNLKNAFDLQAVHFNTELQMQIDRILSDIPSKMSEIIATSQKTQTSLDKMFNEFDAVMNDPDLKQSLAKAAAISQKIELQEQERELRRQKDEEAQIAKWKEETEEAEAAIKRKKELQDAKKEALEKQVELEMVNEQKIEKPIVKKKKQIKGMD